MFDNDDYKTIVDTYFTMNISKIQYLPSTDTKDEKIIFIFEANINIYNLAKYYNILDELNKILPYLEQETRNSSYYNDGDENFITYVDIKFNLNNIRESSIKYDFVEDGLQDITNTICDKMLNDKELINSLYDIVRNIYNSHESGDD